MIIKLKMPIGIAISMDCKHIKLVIIIHVTDISVTVNIA